MATSPALALWLLPSVCPSLAMLLLLLMLLLQMPGAPFSRATPRRAVQVVSESGERSVATGATAPSRNQNMRPTIYRLPFSL